MRKTFVLVTTLLLALVAGLAAAVPAQAANSRYTWIACEPKRYDYREIGLHTNMIRTHSCIRAYQIQDALSGAWRTQKMTAYGAITCKVNVPYDTRPPGTRFAYGQVHACSVDPATGFMVANDDDYQESDAWNVSTSGSDGFWSACLGQGHGYSDACNTWNSNYWVSCTGGDIWNSEFDWIDVGLNGYVRSGVVSISTSYQYGC